MVSNPPIHQSSESVPSPHCLNTQVEHEVSAGVGKRIPTTGDVDKKPWKYIGYKGYTKFIASEDDFFLLRRFDSLNVRVGLALQDEISELEQELEEMDNALSKISALDFNNGTIRQDVEERTDLIVALSKKLVKYNEFLIQQRTLRTLSKAPRRDIKNHLHWHENHGNEAIATVEQDYLNHKNDLVALAQKEKTPLRQVIDGSLRLRTLPLWRHRENEGETYDKEDVSHYSDKRMDSFASAVIIAVGVLMLITPIWILQALTDLKAKLAVITAFIFVFLLVLSLAMVAKPFEALGATAAYAAVLMVFLQIQSEGS
ncbi:hypothetical protein BDP55DRAFT_274936 [Colletotrichum godetiae]|uniref:DUF6594 domain-containing protein n=1 Tax=Colletotrichum godetiae TaxID=1209918 RepID=A0AAJ0ADQ5_9PEZI|nr:uncharacterized protein BDP55DRAFT_274936 [Colletotrichum godetiae]KAK1671996.1 hypothetical protein BDP55DRAFT_274936 [Colletotrichum godetiae]